MNIIVATSNNWGIGYKNELLFRISADLKRFKEMTMGKTLVMGHNTFKSLPNQKPLPGRKNIVVSRNQSLKIPGAYVANSKEQVMEMVKCEEVFIIGGEQIYNLFLDDCTQIYLTRVMANPVADCFFPDLDKKPEWRFEHRSRMHYADGFEFSYCEYVRKTNGVPQT